MKSRLFALLACAILFASPLSFAGGVLTDRSGTIVTGGTAQQYAPENTSRRYLIIQVPTNGTVAWLNFGTSATSASPSIQLPPGITLTWEGSFVPYGYISIIGAVTGQVVTVKEGQ